MCITFYKLIQTQDGPFVWDSVITGDVVGMFFAGYMVFQMPGGRMAEVFGGKKVPILSVSLGVYPSYAYSRSWQQPWEAWLR